MGEALDLFIGFIAEADEKEFAERLKKGDLLSEIEPFLPMVPEEIKQEIRSLKFSEVKKRVEEEVPEKAALIEKQKKWKELEEIFERLKKSL